MRATLLAVSFSLIVSACAVFGIQDYEEAGFKTLERDAPFSIREYAPYIVASTTVDVKTYNQMGSAAFPRLFDYISGDNVSSEKIEMTTPVFMQDKTEKPAGEKIAMTAPVFMDEGEEGWSMSFVLPQDYTLESAPRPTNPAVKLHQIDGYTAAVIEFPGKLNEKLIAAKTAELEEWMQKNALKPAGSSMAAAYNPPFTLPALRRNEIVIPIGNKNPS